MSTFNGSNYLHLSRANLWLIVALKFMLGNFISLSAFSKGRLASVITRQGKRTRVQVDMAGTTPTPGTAGPWAVGQGGGQRLTHVTCTVTSGHMASRAGVFYSGFTNSSEAELGAAWDARGEPYGFEESAWADSLHSGDNYLSSCGCEQDV